MSNFDWGPDSDESPEQISEALRKVTSESHKRRVRRNTIAGSAAVLLIFGAFIAGNQLDFRNNSDRSVSLAAQSEAPSPNETTPTVTVPNTTTSDIAANPALSRPQIMYVAKNSNDGKGKIVAVDGRNGKEIRTLVSGSTMNELALGPDGKLLFYTEQDESKVPTDQLETDHQPSLKSIPVAGGSATFHAYNAHFPRVSPDANKVAFTKYGTSQVSGDLMVLDIPSHKVTQITVLGSSAATSNEVGWVQSVVGWTDNSHVAAIIPVFPFSNDKVTIKPNQYLHVFDISKTESYYEYARSDNTQNIFTFPKVSVDTYYFATLVKDNQVLVVESNGDKSASRVLLLDAKSGKIVKLIATGYIGRAYGNPAVDSTGNHFAYMSANDVRVSDFGSNPEVLTTGALSVAW